MSNRRPWRTRRCCHNGRRKNKTHKNNIQSAGAAPPPSSTIGQQKKTFSTAELTITMNTNLPEENSLQTKQIKLTGDMLDVKGAEGRGPYFTPDVRYKDGSKVFSGLTQKEKVAIFFDQRKFNNFIQQCYINRKERDPDEYQTLVVNALEPPSLMHRNFAESNIMFMLSQIIKISYPQITEVSESYQGNIYSPNLFEQFLRYGINTYLKIGGKDYTITKARWQNDFYSHPEYFDLYTKYDKYTKWYDTNKENLISNLEPAFGIYFKPNIDKAYVYDRNIIEYVLAAIAEDFLPLDIVKKKMANISVPLLNDDKVNISARTYGATDSFSEYKMRLDLIDEKKKKDKENIETEKKQARENLKEFIEKTLLEHSSGTGDFPAEASYKKHLNKKRNFYNKILSNNFLLIYIL